MPLRQQAEHEPPQCGERRLPRTALPYGTDDQPPRLGDPVEEEILLAREVIEDRHRRHLGGAGHLGDGDLVEAVPDEQHCGLAGDPLPGTQLLALAERQPLLRHREAGLRLPSRRPLAVRSPATARRPLTAAPFLIHHGRNFRPPFSRNKFLVTTLTLMTYDADVVVAGAARWG